MQFTKPFPRLIVTSAAVCGWESPAGLGMQVLYMRNLGKKKAEVQDVECFLTFYLLSSYLSLFSMCTMFGRSHE